MRETSFLVVALLLSAVSSDIPAVTLSDNQPDAPAEHAWNQRKPAVVQIEDLASDDPEQASDDDEGPSISFHWDAKLTAERNQAQYRKDFKLNLQPPIASHDTTQQTAGFMNIFLTCLVFPMLAAFYFSLLWEELMRAIRARNRFRFGNRPRDEEAMSRRMEIVKEMATFTTCDDTNSEDVCKFCCVNAMI
jgi:hypothetical protein